MAKMLLPASLTTSFLLASLVGGGCSKLVATENATHLVINNDRLNTSVEKASGAMVTLELDGQNLLGTRSGSTGVFYLDCYW